MLIVCLQTIVTAGNVYNWPGAQIDYLPDEDVPRLLSLHAAKLPGDPDPPLPGHTYPDLEPGIYKLPALPTW